MMIKRGPMIEPWGTLINILIQIRTGHSAHTEWWKSLYIFITCILNIHMHFSVFLTAKCQRTWKQQNNIFAWLMIAGIQRLVWMCILFRFPRGFIDVLNQVFMETGISGRDQQFWWFWTLCVKEEEGLQPVATPLWKRAIPDCSFRKAFLFNPGS